MNAIDLSATRAAIVEVAQEIAAMIRQAPDPQAKVPRSQWTVAETAAHLAIAQKGMAEIATGAIPNPYKEAALDDFASINAHYLDVFRERDPQILSGLILERTHDFLTTMARLPYYEQVPSPLGAMEVATLCTYNFAHLLMHGHPLARAVGKRSPVNRERALIALPFLQTILPRVYDDRASGGMDAAYRVHMRGGPRFTIVFENGQCIVDNSSSRRVDCHISANPGAFFLVGAGVVPQWGPIARGQLMAWGRKPWLAFDIKTRLPNP